MTQVVSKTWYLSDKVTRDDLDTLYRAGIDFTVCRDEYAIDTFEFYNSNYLGGQIDVQIITHNTKQETWLKLCFGNRIEHFSTIYDDID